MATKSILKNVCISDKRLVHTFIEAYDKPDNKMYKPKKLSRECKSIVGEAIKEFFDK